MREQVARQKLAEFSRAESDERDTYLNRRPNILFMTKHMEVWAPCGDYRDITFSELENAAGGLTMLLPDDDHWAGYFYGQHRDTFRPIVVDYPGWRTFWLTTDFTRTRRGRQKYIEVNAVHCIEYLSWANIWPNNNMPPEFQPAKWYTPIGPASTVCGEIVRDAFRRLQGGDWPILAHPRIWHETDRTAWTSGEYRMDRVYDAVLEICEAEDLQIVPELWLPGDPQPWPQWGTLHSPTLMFDFVPRIHDHSLTGTVGGGLIRTGVEIGKDLLEWVRYPINGAPADPVEINEIAGRDGEVLPVYRSSEWSAATEISQTTHITMATRITGGGSSPQFVNDIATGVVGGLVGIIGGFLGLAGLRLPFLENMVTDILFPFHSLEDRHSAEIAGPWRFREAVAEAQASGLSLQVVQSMKSTAWAHRGYTSHRIEVENGAPYLVGKHIKVGWPVGVEMPDGTVEVDRVTEIQFTDSRSERSRIVLQIGSGAAEQEPGVKSLNKIRRFASWLHRATVGG